MKSKGDCLVSNLGVLNVKEMADNLQQLGKEQEHHFVKDYVMKIRRSRIGYDERSHGEAVDTFCKDEKVVLTDDRGVEEDIYQALEAGKIVTVKKADDNGNHNERCWLEVCPTF